MPLSSLFQRLRQMASPGHAALSEAVHVSPSDVEAARVRARRRLIGMVVLVGAGVVGFPWLFETQPRPMSQDVELVQAQGGAGGDGLSVARGVASRTASGRIGVAGIVPPAEDGSRGGDAGADARDGETREVISSKPPADSSDTSDKDVAKSRQPEREAAEKQAEKAADKAARKPADKPVKLAEKPAEKSLEKPADKASDKAADKSGKRYVVQFGAFADANAARTARMKVERLGIKTYAQQIDTPAGKRIRVRIGPYADKAEADKALATLRKAGLAGALLTL